LKRVLGNIFPYPIRGKKKMSSVTGIPWRTGTLWSHYCFYFTDHHLPL